MDSKWKIYIFDMILISILLILIFNKIVNYPEYSKGLIIFLVSNAIFITLIHIYRAYYLREGGL